MSSEFLQAVLLRVSGKGAQNTYLQPGRRFPALDASLHRRERREGHFDRTITIPIEVDADRVKAEYRDGILSLLLPRAERDKPNSITIR